MAQYKIVAGDVTSHIDDFEAKINDLIAEGWEPQGGVAVFEDEGGRIYMYQAMVRRVS